MSTDLFVQGVVIGAASASTPRVPRSLPRDGEGGAGQQGQHRQTVCRSTAVSAAACGTGAGVLRIVMHPRKVGWETYACEKRPPREGA
ncbi:hypothetical protein GCM10023238_22710 [Streptomyces heliomycini]